MHYRHTRLYKPNIRGAINALSCKHLKQKKRVVLSANVKLTLRNAQLPVSYFQMKIFIKTVDWRDILQLNILTVF